MPSTHPTSSLIQVFGTDSCAKTAATRRKLDHLGVEYEYVDLGLNDDAREWVRSQTDGDGDTPSRGWDPHRHS